MKQITFEQAILMSNSSIGARIQAAISLLIPEVMIFDREHVITDIVIDKGFDIMSLSSDERKALSVHGNTYVKKYMATKLSKISHCAFGLLMSEDEEILKILTSKDVCLNSLSENEMDILITKGNPKTLLVLARHGYIETRMLLGENELVVQACIDSFSKDKFLSYIKSLVKNGTIKTYDKNHKYYSHKDIPLTKILQEELVKYGYFDRDIDTNTCPKVIISSLDNGFDLSIISNERLKTLIEKSKAAADVDLEYWRDILISIKKFFNT